MTVASGFMIPLNEKDWISSGDRSNNWCGDPLIATYLNENIFLQGANVFTTPEGEAVKIQVGIQGVVEPPNVEPATNLGVVQHVQAWVCYPNTSNQPHPGLLVPSMQGLNPAWTGSHVLEGVDPTSNPEAYQDVGGQAPSFVYFLASLSPQWIPTAEDLVPPNQTGYCCIFATCQGLAPAVQDGDGGYLGDGVGTFVPPNADPSSLIDICTSPYQGQRNIAIVYDRVRVSGSNLLQFGFLAVGSSVGRPKQVVLEVTPVRQLGQVDPAVLRVLKAGPHRDLPLQPASSGLKGLRLSKNTYECKGYLARIILEAEEIAEEVIEALEHPFRHTSRLRLKLPPKGIQPMLLTVELDASLPPGSVHTFDITQTDETGKRGGIRVAAIVVP
jgi:hypothetical protein